MTVQDPSSSSSLSIHLLGRFLVEVHGRPLPETAIKGRKARSLLKLLALQRQGRLVRDQAMDALWPDLQSTSAASQLYKALHHIRSGLTQQADGADEWIEMSDDFIRLDPPGETTIDVHRFEEHAQAGLRDHTVPRLETAVSLYGGDLLPMDVYAEWTTLPREHYRQRYLDVLTTLAEQYEQRGELSEAAQMHRLALEKDSALESSHRSLMRIFARLGQRTRAFRQYDLCREVLHQELAMGPSPETKDTLDAIREQRWSTDTSPRSIGTSAPSPMAPLVGREEERAAIDESLERITAGKGGALLVRGGMGLGKTRLIRELALRARRRGFRVFSGEAREGSGVIAYGPFVKLCDEILHEYPALQEALPEELGQLVPSFSGDGIPVPHADRRAAQGYLFAQVQRFFAQLAEEGPVVAMIDDLHAADEASRELFSYLIRHGSEVPALFVGTTRNEEAAFGVEGLSPGPESAVTVIDLSPLSAREHATLLRQHDSTTPSDDTIDRIFERSEGNPLFALELLDAREEDSAGDTPTERDGTSSPGPAASPGPIPSSLRASLQERLEALTPPARRLVSLAAVIGGQVSYDLLASVWEETDLSEEHGLFEPLQEVTRAGLLDEHGLDYSFRHTLVREGVYASISTPRRRTLHAGVARQLVSRSEDAEAEPVEEIAHHYLRVGELRQGIHYLVRAAERAEAAYAHEDALTQYEDALEVLETVDESWAWRFRCDVLGRMGDVYRACGRLERSYDVYRDAVALAADVPMSESDRVELHRKMALVAIFRTDVDRAERHLERASSLVEEDTRAQVRVRLIEALRLWHVNQLEEAYDVGREALERAEALGAASEASQACEILSMTCLPLGRWEEGLEYEKRRQFEGWSPEIVVATDAHLCLWEYHVSGDQPFERARSFMEQVAEQASELGDLRCVAVCHYALGTMYLWRGAHEKAIDELEASLELHERVGSPAGMAYVRARQGVLHTMQGATEAGWQSVQEGIDKANQAAVRDHCLQRLYGIGIWNRIEASDPSAVRDLVTKSEALLDETGACGACALELHPWLAYFYLDTGTVPRARECGETVAALAEKTGNPIGEALATMIESNVLAAEKEDERAQRRREEAFALAKEAVTEATHSPIVHYLDRMADQQAALT